MIYFQPCPIIITNAASALNTPEVSLLRSSPDPLPVHSGQPTEAPAEEPIGNSPMEQAPGKLIFLIFFLIFF